MSLVSWLNGRVALLITAIGITARSVKLEVRGRISGKPIRLSVSPSDLNGKKYLVSLFGERAWVKNARAAHGEAFHHPWRPVDEFTFVRSLSTSELPIDPGVERLLI